MRYVSDVVGMPVHGEGDVRWERLGNLHGVQMSAPVADEADRYRAKRKKLSMAAIERVRVHCQECGKRETPRDRCIVTRSSLVCADCYDETKHGLPSTTEHPPPDRQRQHVCSHPRHRTGIRFDEYVRQFTYCLDCGKDVNHASQATVRRTGRRR